MKEERKFSFVIFFCTDCLYITAGIKDQACKREPRMVRDNFFR